MITVRLKTPLLIGDESGTGNFEQAIDYIPGTVLRGAVGKRLLESSCTQRDHARDHRSCPDRDTCAFWRVFGEDHPPQFGHAYPATRRWGFPFPATARTCKYHPGYHHSDANPEGHGVFDTLIGQSIYDLVSDPAFPHRSALLPDLDGDWAKLPAPYAPVCRHPNCQGRVNPATGYYLLDDDGPAYAPRPTISRATHVGINRARGVAEDALLFTLETIEPGPNTQFRARLTYDDTYADALSEVLDLDGTTEFTIGRGRSRGLGRVEVSVVRAPDLPGMGKRLARMNRQVRKALTTYHQADERVPESFPGQMFSLTLRAAAVLVGEAGTPTLWPDLAPFGLGNARQLRAWARTTHVGGWNAAAGLPRATQQAVEPGGVYLFYAPLDTIEQSALMDRLKELEDTGIGTGRERGYGQVTVCAPFHYAGWRK
jgi:CRISPR-associated protein Csx10